MQKDLKIGLVLGTVLAITATLWLATHPRLSPKARMQPLHNAGFGSESTDQSPSPVITESPASDPGVGQRGNPPVKSESINLNRTLGAIPDLTVYEQAEKIKPEKFHIVRKGQTLSGIAYEYYGSASKWTKILDANKKTIKDANKLREGTKLFIPE